MNANGRRLDAWLIYRCCECDQTWNRPLLERLRVERIRDGLLSRLQVNDAELARQHAFDRAALARLGVRVEAEVGYRVLRPDPPRPGRVLLELGAPLQVRLERLLASELGVSRERVRSWARSDRLGVSERELRRPVRDGQVVVVPSEPWDGQGPEGRP